MLLPLIVLFVLIPIAELYVIIQVGQAIGALPTIALLILDSVLGAMLLRSQGRAAWRRFDGAVAARRPPGREVADGGLILFGGALLLTPGFLSDILGVLLLLPPTRAVVRRLLLRHFTSRIVVAVAGGPQTRRTRQEYDVDGTAHEVRRDQGRLP